MKAYHYTTNESDGRIINKMLAKGYTEKQLRK